MSDKKISQLTSLAQNDVVVSTDVLPIVDTSATETKKIAVNALVGAAAAAGLTNVDINSGTIDGATIATSDITVGSGKTLNVSAGTLTLADNQISGDKVEGGTINAITINTLTSTAVNATTVDATNVEVTNVKAKDGTAAATIADSTGVVSITANPILSGGTANGVLYLNGSKVATSGSALTFDGTTLANINSDGTGFSTQNAASNFSIMRLGTDSVNGYAFFQSGKSGTGTTLPFAWRQDSTELMRLTSTGLGIGTSSPAYKLDVSGTNDQYIRVTTTTAGGYAAGIRMNSTGSREFGIFADSSMRFYDFTASATRLTLDSSGNLGIGTSSPTDKLQVGAFSGNNVITVGAGTAGVSSVYFGDGTGADRYRGYIDYVHTSDRFEFGTSATTKATLDSSGNLGLGVTPSAWSIKALQVNNSSIASDSNDTYIQSNAFFDGSWKYINSAEAAQYYQVNGSHVWRYAPSGTAGNTISFTQAMTLESGGQLLVGTTTKGVGNNNNTFFTVAGGATVYTSLIASGGQELNLIAQSGLLGVYARTNDPLLFGTNNTERARITSGGYSKFSNAGTYAGSTASYHELRQSTDEQVCLVTNTSSSLTGTVRGMRVFYTAASPNGTDNYFLYCDDSTALRAGFRSNGGLANYQSNNVDLSDARTKKDINPAASMWDKIGALEIVTYKYNDQTHDDVNVGVIAQQVEAVEPVWVDSDGFGETPEGEEPLKTVYTKDITFAAIKALQEAMARIEQLEAKVAALETK
jgi:hypothetical protein